MNWGEGAHNSPPPYIFGAKHDFWSLSLIFLLISNPTSKLSLHQFLGTKTTEANKSLKTDAKEAY